MDLLAHLTKLEKSLHTPEGRQDKSLIDTLIHDQHREIGRSGSVFTKADHLENLPNETGTVAYFADDFALMPIATGVMMLTYRTYCRIAGGDPDYFALRSSLWVETTPHHWQMIYHQGTLTEPWG